jgi:hypothetical protein
MRGISCKSRVGRWKMRINLKGIKSGAVITWKTLAGRRPCRGSGSYFSTFYRVGSIKRRSVNAEFVVESVTQVEVSSSTCVRAFLPIMIPLLLHTHSHAVRVGTIGKLVGTIGKLVVARNMI